jgi:3D (Asp-Asp-Asp) domain-containing protein
MTYEDVQDYIQLQDMFQTRCEEVCRLLIPLNDSFKCLDTFEIIDNEVFGEGDEYYGYHCSQRFPLNCLWKDDEEIQIIDVPTIIDDEEIEEVKEVCGSECDNEQETSNDVRVDTESPRFVMDGRWNVGYTRTWYDVDVEGGILSSYGKYWNDKDMRVEGNFIQYNDEQYGWINVYALNVDQMKEYGTVVTSTVLGSIIEVKLPNSASTHYGIVLDVCGACAKAKKIDVWVKNQYVAINNGTHIDNEVEFRFKRFGFDGEPIVYKEK